MNTAIKTSLAYGFVLFASIFLYMSARWYSYRTPHVQRVSYEKVIEKNDPLINRFKNKPKEGMFYYQSVQVTITDSAGNFPFLADTKYDTVITVWSRASRLDFLNSQ